MVSRKAHNLKNLVRFQAPQPRKENLLKFSTWRSLLKASLVSKSYHYRWLLLLRESRDEIFNFILRDINF